MNTPEAVSHTSDARASFCIRGGDYEHVLGVPEAGSGITLTYEPMTPNDIFRVMLESRPFEVCEFSLANYITLRARGESWLTAIPVFPNRAFRHGTVFTRNDSDLVALQQLEGKRIGVDDYSMTAAVWVRGLLEDDYGVDWRSITWVTGAKQRFVAPAGARIDFVDAAPEDLLLAGHVDAIIGFALKDARRPWHHRALRTVLRDSDAVELAYFERTAIYPINHCVVLRTDVHEAHPALIDVVARAYVRAKNDAYARRLGSTLVPWGKSSWARAFDRFDGDPLPYGLTATNRRVVSRLGEYLLRQGFIENVPPIDDLFTVPSGVAFECIKPRVD
ncbi:MAG: hypothetical protein H7125_09905 [Proteobacteria bacterium]|nr:hypothetical protein [Burkholderiales bacterium]